MNRKLLIKRITRSYLGSEKIIFSVWTDGSYCYERLMPDEHIQDYIFAPNDDDKEFESDGIPIFKSLVLAQKVQKIIDSYYGQINQLPKNLESSAGLSICDGGFDWLQIKDKKFKGNNFLTELPYKAPDASFLEKLTEEQKQNEQALAIVLDLYYKVENTIDDYKKQIHDFAFENMNPFKDEKTELSFGKKCDVLGFKMDSGKSFYTAFPDAYKSSDELQKVLDKITDIDLLGSAVYSKWRYFTNWALPDEEKPVEWFSIAMSRLAEILEK